MVGIDNNQTTAENIIRDVMNRDEFQEPEAYENSLLTKIFDYIREALDKVFGWLSDIFEWIFNRLELLFTGGSGDGSTISLIIRIVVMIVIAAVIIIGILLLARYLKNKNMNKDAKNLSEELVSYAQRPDEPMELAQQYRSEGNYRLSVRYLFISMLVNFNKKKYIAIHIAKTNRDYRDELRHYDENIYAMSELFFDSFNLCWYGGRSVTESELNELFDRYAELLGTETGVSA